jgi:hypothetical protein
MYNPSTVILSILPFLAAFHFRNQFFLGSGASTTGGMRSKRRHAPTLSSGPSRPQKRHKIDVDGKNVTYTPPLVQHPTLRLYYNHVCTLRDYLLSRLPAPTSKARVRRLKTAGLETSKLSVVPTEHGLEDSKMQTGNKKPLAVLLDGTIVCLINSPAEEQPESMEKDFVIFSQQSTLSPGSSFEEGTTPQSEVGISFSHPTPNPKLPATNL